MKTNKRIYFFIVVIFLVGLIGSILISIGIILSMKGSDDLPYGRIEQSHFQWNLDDLESLNQKSEKELPVYINLNENDAKFAREEADYAWSKFPKGRYKVANESIPSEKVDEITDSYVKEIADIYNFQTYVNRISGCEACNDEELRSYISDKWKTGNFVYKTTTHRKVVDIVQLENGEVLVVDHVYHIDRGEPSIMLLVFRPQRDAYKLVEENPIHSSNEN